jgi:hypothetical protein
MSSSSSTLARSTVVCPRIGTVASAHGLRMVARTLQSAHSYEMNSIRSVSGWTMKRAASSPNRSTHEPGSTRRQFRTGIPCGGMCLGEGRANCLSVDRDCITALCPPSGRRAALTSSATTWLRRRCALPQSDDDDPASAALRAAQSRAHMVGQKLGPETIVKLCEYSASALLRAQRSPQTRLDCARYRGGKEAGRF